MRKGTDMDVGNGLRVMAKIEADPEINEFVSTMGQNTRIIVGVLEALCDELVQYFVDSGGVPERLKGPMADGMTTVLAMQEGENEARWAFEQAEGRVN
jgi:hypothetical protein